MTVKTVLIVDDQKPVGAVLKDTGIWTGFHWEPEPDDPRVTVSVARSADDAGDIIRYSERFDIWLLDFDLGYGPSGAELFKKWAELWPGKVPDDVRACSASSEGMRRINEAVRAFRAQK